MNELGTRLKEARVAKGYSLEDLQDVTKIQKRYLAGIEEGNYSMMPGQFYVRAFIKQYAGAVGLDANELLEQHKAEVPETTKENVRPALAASQLTRRRPLSRSSTNRLNEIMPMVMVALFIILIIFVPFFFYNQLSPEDTPEELTEDGGVQYESPSEESSAAPEEEAPAEEETAEEESAEPEASISVAGTDGRTTTYEWTGPEERELVVAVEGDSWVEVADENQENLMTPATMQAGESEAFDLSGVSEVHMVLGAAPNVTLTLNGEVIEYEQDLTAQNIVINFAEAE